MIKLLVIFLITAVVSLAQEKDYYDEIKVSEVKEESKEYYFFVKALATFVNYSEIENTLLSFTQGSEIDLQFTDRFPVRPSLGLNVNFSGTNEYYWGSSLAYHSTGARIAYSDYSGSTHSDFITSTIAIGLFLNKIFTFGNKFIMFGAEGGILQKQYNTIDFISVSGVQQTETSEFDENSLFIMPNITFGYTFNNILLGLNFGLLLDQNSSSDRDNFGQTVNIPNLVNFQGFRVGLIASYHLNLN